MNILFETQFGSHVYGTNTEHSDVDYKGIYKAPYRDIILNRAKESIVTTTKKIKAEGVRNKAGDVDREYKELRRFIYDAIKGQTYALDMLYTPMRFWTSSCHVWMEIQDNKSKFLSKSMNAFLGYIRQQTGKYAMKGTRMNAVLAAIDYLRTCKPTDNLGTVWEKIPQDEFVNVKEYESLKNKEISTELMLSVLEKKFQANVKVKFVLSVLDKFYEEFGERSKLAQVNQGVDWKAVSHAYRACYQLIDIAKERQIIFPLVQAEYVLKIKMGEVSYKEVVQNELPALMNKAMTLIDNSSLPDTVDPTYWDEFIIHTYET